MTDNRIEGLLSKAKSNANSTLDSLVEKTAIFSHKLESIKSKLRELQGNEKLLTLLGTYFKGDIIELYQSKSESVCISVMYDFAERKKPYMHFFLETDEGKRQIDTRVGSSDAEIREIIRKCPEMTAEIFETMLYNAIEQKLD